ncbi:MAG: MATE family efflux transporter [Eubacteriaceae bacterium]|jgi:putative MATE family efflux protein
MDKEKKTKDPPEEREPAESGKSSGMNDPDQSESAAGGIQEAERDAREHARVLNARSRMLAADEIGPLLLRLSVPAIASQVITLIYTLVNQIFIGHIPGYGSQALAAVGVCRPVLVILGAAAMLVCMGGGPRASICLARGQKKDAEEILNGSFTLILILAVIFAVIYVFFARPILMAIGASADTIDYACNYLKIYGLGNLFVIMTYGLNLFIMSQGFTKNAMFVSIIGAVVNIALDPVFVFVIPWGISGVALATMIGQMASSLYAIHFLRSRYSTLFLDIKASKINWKLMLPALKLGTAPFIMAVTDGLTTICYNSSLLLYGGTLAVGAFAVLSNIMSFMLLPMTGLTQGAMFIMSYNYGAGNIGRLKKTFNKVLFWCLFSSLLLWGIVELAPGFFAGIFTSDQGLIDFTIRAVRIYLMTYGLFGIVMACQYTLISIDKPMTALFLALFRKVILIIPLIYILPMMMADKTAAVLSSQAIADLAAAAVTYIMFKHTFRNTLNQLEREKQTDA